MTPEELAQRSLGGLVRATVDGSVFETDAVSELERRTAEERERCAQLVEGVTPDSAIGAWYAAATRALGRGANG
jgi:hypothetical protein